MAKRKSSAAERYWYAIGYHDGIRSITDKPSKDLIEFINATIGINIDELYEDGWKVGQKDQSLGIDGPSSMT